MRWLILAGATVALFALAFGTNAGRAATDSAIYLPDIQLDSPITPTPTHQGPFPPTPFPTISPTVPISSTPTFCPFCTITPTATMTTTHTPVPSCSDRQVETFTIAPQRGQQTMSIPSVGQGETNLTAWIVVSGGDEIVQVAFYNQWQSTNAVEVDGQGTVQDVVPHPASSIISVNNPTLDQPGAPSKSVQVTYQACAGEWPPGVGTFTPTPTASDTPTDTPTGTPTPTASPTSTSTPTPTITQTPICQAPVVDGVDYTFSFSDAHVAGPLVIQSTRDTVTFWFTLDADWTGTFDISPDAGGPAQDVTNLPNGSSIVEYQPTATGSFTWEIYSSNCSNGPCTIHWQVTDQICHGNTWPPGIASPTATPRVTKGSDGKRNDPDTNHPRTGST